jgi:hypothetical protein
VGARARGAPATARQPKAVLIQLYVHSVPSSESAAEPEPRSARSLDSARTSWFPRRKQSDPREFFVPTGSVSDEFPNKQIKS